MRAMPPSVLILILLLGVTPALAQLPPEILADSHLLRAEQAIRDGDPARARTEIDKILLLRREHKIDLSQEFHFRCANAAAGAGLPNQALKLVQQYLLMVGRSGSHYMEALELMNQAVDEAAGSKVPQADSPGPSVPAPATIQSPIEAQSESGKSLDVPTANQELLNRVGAAETQLATECDLSAWNTKDYFETTTITGVRVCLEAGTNPNARDDYKNTPLHWAAAFNKNPGVIEALLTGGADPNAQNV